MSQDHHRYASIHKQGKSIQTSSSELNTNFRLGATGRGHHRKQPTPDFHNQKPEAELNVMTAFFTGQQRNLTTIITMVKSQTPLIIHPTPPGMCHTLPQLDQQVSHTITMVLLIGYPYSQSPQLIVISLMKTIINMYIIPT